MDYRNKVLAWWNSLSSSSKLVYFVAVPLILASGFVFELNQTPPNYFWSSSTSHSWPPSAASDTSISFGNVSVSRQFSLPAAGHALEAQQPVIENEESVTSTGLWKKDSNLERIEAGLAQARAMIRAARNKNESLDDPDYVPRGPLYLNANVFHRSYMEMEKRFKIYNYEEGEPPVFHYSSMQGILGMEGILIHHIEISKFRTKDPERAHVYFLPFSVLSIVSYVYVVDSHLSGPMKNTAIDYVNLIAQKYPYWNRSLGHDHFMLACHDWGPKISSAVPYLRKNSIRVLCNANTSEKFNPIKDVSMPEIYLPQGTMDGLIGGPSPSKRSILVFYAGGIHGYIRQVLMEHWKNKDSDVQIHEYLPKNMSYYGMVRKSKYCICPSGWEVASPRMVEALYMGCVPVLIKDHYAKPFGDVLNWSTFSVDVAVKDIPNLKTILMSIPRRHYLKMQRIGIQARRHFEVNFPPKRYDVFHMILHSIWLRRLNIQVHDINETST